jgi:RsiW-degrading membrane proteinase PrsW (M82 family)
MQPAQNITPKNERVSTGVLRVSWYSLMAFAFWWHFFHSRAEGRANWREAVAASVATLMILVSAAGTVSKWLERRTQQALRTAEGQEPPP